MRFNNDGSMAYETHGSPTGELMDRFGRMRPASEIAKRDILQFVEVEDNDKPFYLLACYAGASGAAQDVANSLQRPVIAVQTMHEISVYSPEVHAMGIPEYSVTRIGNLRRSINKYIPFIRKTKPMKWKTYYPDP